jgi:hypothetical protein
MQENNFEKQVQQKMDELSIKPSEELWQKVSFAIAKRKTDRRIFVIIFPFVVIARFRCVYYLDQIADGRTNKAIVENAGAVRQVQRIRTVIIKFNCKIMNRD